MVWSTRGEPGSQWDGTNVLIGPKVRLREKAFWWWPAGMPALHCYYPAFNYSVSGRGAEKHWFLMSNEGDRAHEMLRAFSQNTRGGMENICIQCVPPWKDARKYERAHYCTYTSVKTMDPFTPRLTCVFGDWITIGLRLNTWTDRIVIESLKANLVGVSVRLWPNALSLSAFSYASNIYWGYAANNHICRSDECASILF